MSEKNHPIGELMGTTMQKIKEMIDVNTIVGAPIQTPDGVTLIPVSKVAFGFASGGTDFMGKNQKPDQENTFGGGSGAGVNITPVAFLVVRGDSVRLLPMTPAPCNTADRVIEMVPDLVDKITDYIDRDKKKDNSHF